MSASFCGQVDSDPRGRELFSIVLEKQLETEFAAESISPAIWYKQKLLKMNFLFPPTENEIDVKSKCCEKNAFKGK